MYYRKRNIVQLCYTAGTTFFALCTVFTEGSSPLDNQLELHQKSVLPEVKTTVRRTASIVMRIVLTCFGLNSSKEIKVCSLINLLWTLHSVSRIYVYLFMLKKAGSQLKSDSTADSLFLKH